MLSLARCRMAIIFAAPVRMSHPAVVLLLQGKVSLYWLKNGDGHAFLEEAANAVIKCSQMWLDELQSRPDMFRLDRLR